MLSPSLPRVAAAIARSTGSRLQLSPPQAANRLGLSTQVLARLAYLTDGPTRTVKVGHREIEFRHAAPRTPAGAGTAAGAVICALRFVGPAGITPEVIEPVRSVLRDADRKAVAKHAPRAPA